MIFSAVLSGIIRTICVGSFSFAKGQQVLYRKYKPVRITQQEHLMIWNSETTQNLNICLHNYQTEKKQLFFSPQSMKNNYGMQLFKIFHTENTSIQQKNGGFWEELLSENDFEAVLINFCCYEVYYSPSASEAVQKRRLAQVRTLLELCQLTNSYFHSYTYEKTFSSLLPAYWRYKPGFCFFFLPNKNE